ncbi:MAG: site-specific DNA-methyltransferase, partial [Proteobacteria bacterium]|nr:site-specific DNA-methyltransferase [Pseudomonadota bacterium]
VIDNIQISKALEDFPELRALKTKKAIKKAVKGCEMVVERAAAITVWEDVIEKEDTVEIFLRDAVIDITEVPDGSIDILLTDPKYGIEIDKIATSVGGTTGGFSTSGFKFDDSPEDALRLYRLLAPESYRFTTENAHAYVFVAPEFFTPIRNMMITAGWQAHIKPII